ncbi:MAG: hypothetical protein IKE52_00375 [Mogibacterium sp.]|nr:hypothetical protein [Mogibacterium sp.]
METVRNIKKRIEGEIVKIRADKEMMSRIYLVTLGTALIILALAIKGPEQRGSVITDGGGRAIEIERYSLGTNEIYDFEVAIKEGSETLVKEIRLKVQAVSEASDSSLLGAEMSRDAEIDAALDSAISDIEYSKSRKISLPTELDDGTEIVWTPLIKKDYSALILIPAIYIGLLVLIIRSRGEKEEAEERVRRQSILRGLPRFCNQLFLMMNAGMILSDAFDRITSAYSLGIETEGEGNSDKCGNYFERELVMINMKNRDKRESTAGIINEFAVKNDVKEMIRIATILKENEKRGSDVIESLSRESRYLWDERKTVAREKGKMIDTKMSYPLGILLILLIVITMAPAMLSM